MPKFSSVEKLLLDLINDDRLISSLGKIREVMEDIWEDTPRIVKDYTDHGVRHSERLAEFVYRLLDANYGVPISSQEMYLLLAGIYLHDIGMQCDVVKFDEIRKVAEELGSSFEVEFKSLKASDYYIQEQIAIRKNHHYLTAAWIDYAYCREKTVLGNAAQTIPDNLVEDLMDVCKYHSKLNIMECPEKFKFDVTQRKRLVAALLRFADELDVSSNRVNIETIKNFSIDPKNSLYWWLHNRTQIVFSSRNMITITIRLHPTDVKEHGSEVYSTVITEFENKNKPVFSILEENDMPIAISQQSGIIENKYAKRLPPDIVKLMNEKKEGHRVQASDRDVSMMLPDDIMQFMQQKKYQEHQVNISERIYLVHSSEVLAPRTEQYSGRYNVRVWLEAYDNDIDECSRVTYRLYDDFSHQVIATASKNDGFLIELFCYGEFTIVAYIERTNKPPLVITRYLDLPGRPPD